MCTDINSISTSRPNNIFGGCRPLRGTARRWGAKSEGLSRRSVEHGRVYNVDGDESSLEDSELVDSLDVQPRPVSALQSACA